MQDFKVKFRGTRGSYPTPKANFLAYGGNTACVEVNVNNHLIILDAGTGIIELGRDLVREHILSSNSEEERIPINATIFLTHVHQDHIQGLPFFSPAYLLSTKLAIYGMSIGGENLKDTLSSVLYEKVFPLGLDDINCDLKIENFSEKQALVISPDGEKKLVKILDLKYGENDVVITSHKTHAHPKEGCLCIKIQYKGKTLVYATDKESYVGSDKKFIEFSHNCDLLIHDSQYTQQEYTSSIFPKQGFGHSTFEMAIEAAKLSKAKKLAFFHFDPTYDDEMLLSLENEYQKQNLNWEFAKENSEIVL